MAASIQSPKDTTIPHLIAKEILSRISWGVFIVIYALLVIVVFWRSVQVISSVSGRVGFLMAIFGIVAIAFFSRFQPSPFVMDGGTATFELFTVLNGPAKSTWLGNSTTVPLPSVLETTTIIIAVGTGTVMVLVFAFCIASYALLEQNCSISEESLAANQLQAAYDEFENRLTANYNQLQAAYDNLQAACDGFEIQLKAACEKFETQSSGIARLVQCVAASLVAGIIYVYVGYELAMYHMAPQLQSTVHDFARGWTAVVGVMYTGLLCAIYLPLLLVQMQCGRNLLYQIHQAYGPKTKIEKTSFLFKLTSPESNTPEAIKWILTILSPLLVSWLTSLYSTVFPS